MPIFIFWWYPLPAKRLLVPVSKHSNTKGKHGDGLSGKDAPAKSIAKLYCSLIPDKQVSIILPI